MTYCESAKEVFEDLSLNVNYGKGQVAPVKNCWHFYSNGAAVDVMFRDDEDFRDAMNRIFVLKRKYGVVILAFCLMETHVHFVLHGERSECSHFLHEFMRRTSLGINMKYGDNNKLGNVDVDFQEIKDDLQLKSVICYVVRNPYSAGLSPSPWDYPWSSGPLYFRCKSFWTSAMFLSDDKDAKGALSVTVLKSMLKTRVSIKENIRMFDGLVFPGEYVDVDLCERVFRTSRCFNYFLFKGKDIDVESQAGMLSRLSIPIGEMRRNRDSICKERFGEVSMHTLSIKDRIILAKILKSRYDCSLKQIARVCGLVYDEVKGMI